MASTHLQIVHDRPSRVAPKWPPNDGPACTKNILSRTRFDIVDLGQPIRYMPGIGKNSNTSVDAAAHAIQASIPALACSGVACSIISRADSSER
jgi:hypothetical protein